MMLSVVIQEGRGYKMSQKILVSIDTEGPDGHDPIERMVYGRTRDGHEYGVRYLIDLFNERNIRGLFFVDIPEIADHSESKIRDLLLEIDSKGHDIGVHVHPDHMADINRRYLWQYYKEEQYEIIAKCTDFYEKVLHRAPLSFRAGRYGANNDTLEVLEKLGYKYDMSLFHTSRYCKIDPHFTWNRVVSCSNRSLKEVPVTTFRSFQTPFYYRNDQIDSGNYPMEFKRNMDLILKTGTVDVVSLFFHSFQFLDWRKNPDDPKLDQVRFKRVMKNLDYLDTLDIEFIAECDLEKIGENQEDKMGALDASQGILPYVFFARRAVATAKARLIRNV